MTDNHPICSLHNIYLKIKQKNNWGGFHFLNLSPILNALAMKSPIAK